MNKTHQHTKVPHLTRSSVNHLKHEAAACHAAETSGLTIALSLLSQRMSAELSKYIPYQYDDGNLFQATKLIVVQLSFSHCLVISWNCFSCAHQF
jgi:hypothetical protein